MHPYNTSLMRHLIVNADVENAFGGLMKNLPVRGWTEPPVASLIVPLTPLTETAFLRSLFMQLASLTAFFANGRLNFYAFISGREVYYITASQRDNNLIRCEADRPALRLACTTGALSSCSRSSRPSTAGTATARCSTECCSTSRCCRSSSGTASRRWSATRT